ncbi:MAG: ATP-binding protein [Oscillospiraceae bacterium]|nr:ATP-binding protein [Oscillospiraceae bacterium]
MVTECPICGEPLSIEKKIGNTVFPFPRACKCVRVKLEHERIEQEKAERYEKYHDAVAGIPATMRNKTFEADLYPNSKVSVIAKQYVANWKENKKQNKGLLLVGFPRNGKTYIATAIGNEIAKQYLDSVYLDNYLDMIRKVNNYKISDDLFERIENASLLIIDDLQRIKEKDRSTTYEIINRRYVTNKPFIITTNLTDADIKNLISEDVQNDQVFSRILQVCEPIGVSNPLLVNSIYQ